jgi:hypothetical protein
MNDKELDDMLNSWNTPAVPPSLRAGLRLKFNSRQARKLAGIPVRWIVALGLGAGAVVGASLASDGVIGSDAGQWGDRLFARRTQIVRPAIAKLSWRQWMGGRTTGRTEEGGRWTGSVYVYNRLTNVHSGYTWQAQPAGDGQFLFTVLPLDPAAIRERGAIVPLSDLPKPAVVRAGSSLEVPVYAVGGLRLVDRYEFAAETLPIEMQVEGAERAAMITITNPKLYRGGAFAADSGGVVEAKGASVSVSVRGLGTFILVVDRQTNRNFVENGHVSGNAMEFEHAGERFRVECTAPIAGGGSRPLYVYLRAGSGDGSTFGSGGWAPSNQ